MVQYVATQSFNRGEVAPEFWDRNDVDFYPSACRRLDNWFPLPAGGVTTRPPLGTLLWDGASNVLPASADQETYEVPLPDTTALRVAEVRGAVVWITVAWVLDDESDLMDPDLRPALAYGRLQRDDNDAWTASIAFRNLGVGQSLPTSTWFGEAYPNGVGVPSLAKKISTASVGPAVFVASEYFRPLRIFLDQDTGELDHEDVIFYEELLGTIEASNGSPTITGTDTLFNEQLEVGSVVQIEGENYEVQSIAGAESLTLTANYTGTTVAGVRMGRQIANTEAPFGGPISSGTTLGEQRHWPFLVTFFKSRLVFFTTIGRPTGMWASKPNDPFTLFPGSVYDDAPIDVDLFAEAVDEFRWAVGASNLLLGSSRGEYAVQTDGDGPMTPTNFAFFRIGSSGSDAVPAIPLEGRVVHVAKGSAQVFANQFDFARQGFVSEDLALLSSHLLTGRVSTMAYRSPRRDDPAGRLFFVLDDAAVRVLTINERQGILAWHRLTMPGGETSTGSKVIMASATTSDAAFFMVRRGDYLTLVALGEDRSSELELDFQATFEDTTSKVFDLTDSPFLQDSYVSVWSAALGYLGVYEVSGTTLDLTGVTDDLGAFIYVGLPYTAECDLLPALVATRAGTLMNRRRRLVRTVVSVQETTHLHVNGVPMSANISPVPGLETYTGTYEQRQLGWVIKEDSGFSTPGVFRATVLSLTREVGS